MFSGQFFVGVLITTGSVAFHALGLVGLLQCLIPQVKIQKRHFSYVRAVTVTSLAVLVIFILHAIIVLLWAYHFTNLGEFSDFGRAVYFSLVTYTTLGYGDITLSESYQILSGLEAINGIILFGVSTASLFAIFQRFLQRP